LGPLNDWEVSRWPSEDFIVDDFDHILGELLSTGAYPSLKSIRLSSPHLIAPSPHPTRQNSGSLDPRQCALPKHFVDALFAWKCAAQKAGILLVNNEYQRVEFLDCPDLPSKVDTNPDDELNASSYTRSRGS
jgi:hypothetical protein